MLMFITDKHTYKVEEGSYEEFLDAINKNKKQSTATQKPMYDYLEKRLEEKYRKMLPDDKE